MPSRKAFFTPKAGLVILGILVAVLTILTPFLSLIPINQDYNPETHALFEYFVAYIGICLFFICLRRFQLQRTKELLFWGLGFLTFVIFQVCQNFAYPGFHDFVWFPVSSNLGTGFELAGRMSISIYFLIGILTINKRLLQPSFRYIILTYLSALVLVVFVVVSFFSFLPEIFYVDARPTLIKKGLDIVSAVLLFVAAVLSVRHSHKEKQAIYIGFVAASVFGIFANIHLSLSNGLFDVFFDAGHVFKLLFFTVFLVGLFADQSRFVKIEAGLRESLEKAKGALEKSEKTYRELAENMADGFVVTDKFGIVIFANQAFADMLNQREENLIGRHFSAFFSGTHYEKMALESLHKHGRQKGRFEVELLEKFGKKKPALINAVSITESNGEFAGIQAIVIDLTERKEIEKNLDDLVREKTKSLTIFKQCIESSTDGILIISLDGSITYLNRAFETMTGFSKDELIEQKTSVLMYDKQSENVHQNIWKSLKQGRIWHGEFYTKKNDGRGFIGDVAVVPINDEHGRTTNYLWMEKDITRGKTLERSLERYAEELTEKTSELESAKSYYETLISGMSDILIVVDNKGQCTFLNDYGMRRLRLRAEDLTRENLPIFFGDLKRLEKDYGSSLRMEIKDFEAPIKTKKGESILCSWHAKPLIDRHKRRIGAMAVGRDITEYKRMQDELQEYTRNLESSVKERTKELQQRVSQLAKLLEIGEEIRLNVDIDVILNKICEAVQALGWNKVIVSLRNYETQCSRVVAALGLRPDQVEEVMSWGDIPFESTEKYLKNEFRISNSYFVDHEANIIDKNTPFSVYTEMDKRGKDEWHPLDALIVPIRTLDRILGIISVDDPTDRKKPTQDKIRDLEIFADKAAMAIENARLFQVQKENEKQARFLAEIGQIFHSSLKMAEVLEAIVGKGGKVIGEFCSLLLLDEKGEHLVPQASYHEKPELVDLYVKGCNEFPPQLEEGVIGEVVSTGEPRLISRPFAQEMTELLGTLLHYVNQSFPLASIMLLPLQVRDRRIGLMLYLSSKPSRRYKDEDLKLAKELADRAALAIENARLFNEAREKAQELEKANKSKTEFLANVSHELRTPLNAVITLSDILIRGIPGKLNDEQIKQLFIIQRSGHNLLNLINDILDLSKIEAGRVEPIYSDVPIRSVVEEAVEHIRPLCLQKGISLDFECSDDVPDVIVSDQDKLTKAITNVLSNAMKFTHTGGIKLGMSMADEVFLKIVIADTGIGIPEDKIGEIFKEFHQIDSTDSRAYGGTGLGLAITRKVLDIIGGSVSVESELDKGSVFTLLIPTKISPEERSRNVDHSSRQVMRSLPQKVELEISDDRDQLDEQKKSILVIDDEKEAIYIMRQYLHEHQYQIIFPQNGENVFELAKRFKPYAVTLDLLMPDQSGWDVLEILKNDPATRNIPVIITSILFEREKALRRGAAGYLVKPIEPQKLLAMLVTLETRTKKKKAILDLPKILNFKKLTEKKFFDFQSRGLDDRRTRARILLVDDDNDTQYAMQYVLEGAGYEVYLAGEGREAVQQAEAVMPELILMDIMMPGMDGCEATRRLKSKPHFRDIPIIAMTAKAMKGDREEILLAGCDDYIAKPFVTKEILSLVEKWLVQSRVSSGKP